MTTTLKTLVATAAIYTGLALAPAAPAHALTTRQARVVTRDALADLRDLLDARRVHVRCGHGGRRVTCRFRIHGQRQTVRGITRIRERRSTYTVRVRRLECR